MKNPSLFCPFFKEEVHIIKRQQEDEKVTEESMYVSSITRERLRLGGI